MRAPEPMTAPHEEAFRQVVAHWTMLNAYVRSIVRDHDLAEDTFSDVAIAVARSWDTYDKSRPFGPWARCITRRIALEKLARRGLRPILLDDQALEALGAEVERLGTEAHMEQRVEALQRCTENLPDVSRKLVRLRYFQNRSYPEIAKTVRWTIEALYVAFSRIHKTLSECVERKVELQ